MFQAQDMGKIGFIQDLLHGIAKVAKRGTAAASGAEPAFCDAEALALWNEHLRDAPPSGADRPRAPNLRRFPTCLAKSSRTST